MRISYAIPVCYEHEELRRLLTQLVENKREQDEIVVQADLGNTTSNVYSVLNQFSDQIAVTEFALHGNFASFKNNLKECCTGEWIFQIDADEYLNPWLIQNLPHILQGNPQTQVFLLPRINTVDGITEEHLQRWRWQINNRGWINFPDYQTRILQNSPKIQWINKVHEVLFGHTSYGLLPTDEEYCILHNKSIARQEVQNSIYDSI